MVFSKKPAAVQDVIPVCIPKPEYGPMEIGEKPQVILQELERGAITNVTFLQKRQI